MRLSFVLNALCIAGRLTWMKLLLARECCGKNLPNTSLAIKNFPRQKMRVGRDCCGHKYYWLPVSFEQKQNKCCNTKTLTAMGRRKSRLAARCPVERMVMPEFPNILSKNVATVFQSLQCGDLQDEIQLLL